ncbi:hypothetical protein JQX13_42645 [Archangium violaceum]|uniref:hypothetical protein n=1 Tax=Archangium violaceum TaxID=83451 RepID=UPI00193BCA59|nr:hypothetical protein [Archangium violaceum]QRK06708.1 hypothetical protein JQX13_42645 [Archangium violaceum]
MQLYGDALSNRGFGYNQGWRVEYHPRTAADVNVSMITEKRGNLDEPSVAA